MALAGVHHLTVSPPLLEQLASTLASEPKSESLFDINSYQTLPVPSISFDDRQKFLTLLKEGNGDGKLAQVCDSVQIVDV